MNNLNFRAWHKEEKRMREVLEISFLNRTVLISANENLLCGSFDEVILMQSTGLKDSKGVEIFEGDVCEMSYIANDEFGKYKRTFIGKATSIASKGACLRNAKYYYSRIKETTEESSERIDTIKILNSERFIYPGYKQLIGYQSIVLGNIYEQPELLEVGYD